MYTVTRYPQGTFCWADCVSTDQDAARKFYSALMGWDAVDEPIGDGQVYTMFKKDGHNVAGLGAMQPGMDGVPSHWTNYVAVDDVDAMAKMAADLGATLHMPPMDVFKNGRMTTFADPEGTTLGIWQANEHIGAGLVNTVGAMIWNEISTRQPQMVKEFYTKLFGWTFQHDDEHDYTMVVNNGRYNGGLIVMNEEWGDMPSVWSTYFAVEDAEASARKVEELGGTVAVPPTTISAGTFTVIADPAGAHCTLFQTDQVDPWEE